MWRRCGEPALFETEAARGGIFRVEKLVPRSRFLGRDLTVDTTPHCLPLIVAQLDRLAVVPISFRGQNTGVLIRDELGRRSFS
jgi:hypothetical protein